MIRSGEHALWDAHLDRAQLHALIARIPPSAELLAEAMRDFNRRFAVAAERAAKAWGEALRPLVEMERRMREGQGD